MKPCAKPPFRLSIVWCWLAAVSVFSSQVLADGPYIIPPSVPRGSKPDKPRKPRRRAYEPPAQDPPINSRPPDSPKGTTPTPKKPPQKSPQERDPNKKLTQDIGTSGISVAAPKAPFKNPRELYDRIREELGLESASQESTDRLAGVNELRARLAKLLKEYRSCKDAKRKQELMAAMKELKLDIETRKHVSPVADYRLRRQSFVSDIIDALIALQVANVNKSWRSIFQCNFTDMQNDFVWILKQMPAEEVAPALWERLEGQIRYSSATGERKLRELETSRLAARKRIQQIRDALRVARSDDEKEKLWDEEAELIRHLSQIEYDRLVVRAAVAKRNGRFKKMASELLGGMGAGASRPLVKGIYNRNLKVRIVAGRILHVIGIEAVPELIAAFKQNPRPEFVGLLQGITGERFGKDSGDWEKWWSKSPKNPAAGRKPAPEAQKQKKGDEFPEGDELVIGFRPGVTEIESVKKRLADARRSREEAELLRRALEKKLKARDSEEEEDEEDDASEEDLRSALRDAKERERRARQREKESLGDLLNLLNGKRKPSEDGEGESKER